MPPSSLLSKRYRWWRGLCQPLPLLVGLMILLACSWPFLARSPLELTGNTERLAVLGDSSPWSANNCSRWQLAPEIIKPKPFFASWKGILVSRVYQNILYHLMEPSLGANLLVSDAAGKKLKTLPIADNSLGLEALGQGHCPWGGQCLFLAETGDPFHLHQTKTIHALDEKSIFAASTYSAAVLFDYGNYDRLHVKAMAVHPLSGDIFLFSYEARRSLVFRLPQRIWQNKSQIHHAEQVGFFPYDQIEEAVFSLDGKRLLIVSRQGIFERSGQADPEHSQKPGWLPFERKIRLDLSGEPQSITYLNDNRSFFVAMRGTWLSARGSELRRVSCFDS